MIRIYNIRILTMIKEQDIFLGEIWVDGARISYVGPVVVGNLPEFDTQIDGKGNLVLPGFKNAHTHTAMTFLRGASDDVALHEWLNEIVFPAENKLTEEDVYWLTYLGVMEYLSSGITACFDMYPFIKCRKKTYAEIGFRAVLCGYVNSYISSVEEMEEQYIGFLQSDTSDEEAESLVSYQLGFHGEYTISEELLKKITNLSKKFASPVFTHCSETQEEVDTCVERTGLTPVQYLNSLGVFDFGGGIFHGVFLTKEDLQVLAEKDIAIVTNPASNLKLASGIANIMDYLDSNVTVSLGTDGPASNNSLDMFREMYLVSVLQKTQLLNPEVLPTIDVLRMATVESAKVMRLEDSDVLAKGKLADLIMIDLQQPNMQPLNNLINHLVYSAGKHNVILTMINGKILYKDGVYYLPHTTEEVFTHANLIKTRILDS